MLDLDLLSDFEIGFDYLSLQASTDGNYWFTLDDGRWSEKTPEHPVRVDLSQVVPEPAVKLRFAVWSDYSVQLSGAVIDDVELRIVAGPDADGDTVADAEDCAPQDHQTFALPGEMSDLEMMPDRITISWKDTSAYSSSYDVMRGDIGQLWTSPLGSGPDEACVEPASPDTTAEDAEPIGAGEGRYYLVRGTNACGPGGYGTDSNLGPRLTDVCP